MDCADTYLDVASDLQRIITWMLSGEKQGFFLMWILYVLNVSLGQFRSPTEINVSVPHIIHNYAASISSINGHETLQIIAQNMIWPFCLNAIDNRSVNIEMLRHVIKFYYFGFGNSFPQIYYLPFSCINLHKWLLFPKYLFGKINRFS